MIGSSSRRATKLLFSKLELAMEHTFVAQLLEKGYKMLFEDKKKIYKIEVIKIYMKDNNFALDLTRKKPTIDERDEKRRIRIKRNDRPKDPQTIQL
ncbi:hypothetical protein CR513_15857, partial [Mucuna pruriens]